jgi:hypothetical protein
MKTALFIFLSVFLLSSASCRKEKLEDYDPEFAGEWKTDTITLTSGAKVQCILHVNGKDSFYGFMCNPDCGVICNCQLRQDGKAKINKKNKRIYIGYSIVKDLVLKKGPYRHPSGRMACDLGDLTYFKQ